MARPPGTSFLGASPTTVEVYLVEYGINPVLMVTDSGSDITLISDNTLKNLKKAPKVKTGQTLGLMEVTGETSISGFVPLSIFIKTDQGPVEMFVEAYIVKGMSTSFLLGNDFADQYCISIIREEEKSYLQFGETGRKTQVSNSIGTGLKKEGHAFTISHKPNKNKSTGSKNHRKNKKNRQKQKARKQESSVRAAAQITILPEHCAKVPVTAHFQQQALFVERMFNVNNNLEDVYGAPDSLISPDNAFLHISNFSKKPIKIFKGQILGIGQDPGAWLDVEPTESSEKGKHIAQAELVRTLADSMLHPKNYQGPDEPNSDSVEGGPKTAEVPDFPCSKEDLFKEIHFSPDLTAEQLDKLKDIVNSNSDAFGLDGRLGNFTETLVEVDLKPDTKPVSLPPFGMGSPEKRRVIDEQMDSWLQLGVIEPSKSPWGAPAFLVYRNGKARMVIDYRKLNEAVIPDEFPLPKQDEILQALTGSQWLSTLDALAGFTQLQIKPEDKEKLAFRTHRGLFQFNRMPFGFRNGPAIFQRVMQGVLAPFLWLFALVYIDDIVIFSKTFEEHMNHLDLVFKAIAKSGITLSPKKCNLGYHSLQLLGQKVSRLGLSTHKEKIDAIMDLTPPRNVHDLQSFLGMMVYFSAYIPFYAWIVAPLFKLLRKEQPWEWGTLQQEAFDLSKKVLSHSPVRAYAIPGLGYRLYSDACDYGIAAILQQVQPIEIKDLAGTKAYDRLKKAYDNHEPIPSLVAQVTKQDSDIPPIGEWHKNFESTKVHVERVIGYWSRSLKTAEKNYSPTEREALALKDGLVKFQAFIEGEKILAITDHAALTWSKTYQNVNRRLLTWGTVFAAYPDMRIIHRAGRVHSNVDPISRLRRRVPFQEGPESDNTIPAPWNAEESCEDSLRNMFEEIEPKFEARVLHLVKNAVHQDISTEINRTALRCQVRSPASNTIISYQIAKHCNTISVIAPDDLQSLISKQENDEFIGPILQDFRTDDHAQDLHQQFLVGDDGLLYFQDAVGAARICVPECDRRTLMIDAHETLTESGHGGFARTFNNIAATYYWTHMSRDIKSFVATCDICQKSKPRRHAPYGLLQPIPIPTQPFEVISMDFIPELPESEGFDNILVIIDKLTKYGLFIPCKNTINEIETAELVFKHVICDYGIPRQIITDRDPKWTGNFWKEICEKMSIRRSLTTAHHPQADGQTEVMNQILEIMIRSYVGPERDDWASLLDPLKLTYNSAVHTSIGFSPAFLLRGYEPHHALNLHKNTEGISRTSKENGSIIEQFNAYRQDASDALVLAQAFQ